MLFGCPVGVNQPSVLTRLWPGFHAGGGAASDAVQPVTRTTNSDQPWHHLHATNRRHLSTVSPARSAIHPDGRKVDWTDFAVGSSLPLYGRTYHITGCDEATRAFLGREGYDVAPNSEAPEGPFDITEKVRRGTNRHTVFHFMLCSWVKQQLRY